MGSGTDQLAWYRRNGIGRKWSSAISMMACGLAQAQARQNGTEHTMTALPSAVPLLHCRQ